MTLMDAVHAPSMHTSTRSSASVSLDLLNQQSHLTFAPFDHVSLRAETCRERRLNTSLSSQSRHICFWTVLSHLSTDITGAACDTSAIWHSNLFSVMTIVCLWFKIGCGLVDHAHHDLSSKYCVVVVLLYVYSIPRVCCLYMSTWQFDSAFCAQTVVLYLLRAQSSPPAHANSLWLFIAWGYLSAWHDCE